MKVYFLVELRYMNNYTGSSFNKGRIVELLNELLQDEFVTVNQYWIFGLALNHQCLNKLGDVFLKETEDERSHVEKLTNRILQLDGKPLFFPKNDISYITSIDEILGNGIEMENTIISKYRKTICELEDLCDYATVDILSEILVEEEKHLSWLTSQLALHKKLGEAGYCAQIANFSL